MVTTEILLQRASDPVFRCIIDQDGVCDQSPIQERSPLVGYNIDRRAAKNNYDTRNSMLLCTVLSSYLASVSNVGPKVDRIL